MRLKLNFLAKTSGIEENIKILRLCNLFHVHSGVAPDTFLSRLWDFVAESWTQHNSLHLTFEGEHFFPLFSHFRHFLCPFVPSYPFHPWSGRRLSPRAVRGVSVTPLATRSTPWRTPRNLLPINSRFCQQAGIISPSINSPGAVLEQFTLLKGLFTFHGQVKKKARRSGGMKYHKNLTL